MVPCKDSVAGNQIMTLLEHLCLVGNIQHPSLLLEHPTAVYKRSPKQLDAPSGWGVLAEFHRTPSLFALPVKTLATKYHEVFGGATAHRFRWLDYHSLFMDSFRKMKPNHLTQTIWVRCSNIRLRSSPWHIGRWPRDSLSDCNGPWHCVHDLGGEAVGHMATFDTFDPVDFKKKKRLVFFYKMCAIGIT